MNPELMSQAMDMFNKMDPEVLASMAQSMGGGTGPGTQASAGLDMPQNAAAMQQMLNDPQAKQMSLNKPSWYMQEGRSDVGYVLSFSPCFLVCRL